MVDQRRSLITRHECAEKLVRTFSSSCFEAARHPFTSKYSDAMVQIAEELPAEELADRCSLVAQELEQICRDLIPAHNFERIV